MLQRTFIHLSNIGRPTEQRLWDAGIRCWSELEQAIRAPKTFDAFAAVATLRKPDFLLRELADSRSALDAGEVAYFADRLPRSEHWRLLSEFEASTVFVDIETTGLSRVYDYITVMGAYRTSGYDAAVHGYDLHEARRLFKDAAIMVTFNGATFDAPFIRHAFPEVGLPPVHIDLRYPLHSLGFKGGLKAIEAQLGIKRRVSEGVDGRDAVHLWYRYLQGEPRALKTLLRYNLDDTAGLVGLSRYVCARLSHRLVNEGCESCESVVEPGFPIHALGAVEGIHERAAAHSVVRERFSVQSLLDSIEMGRPPRVVGIDLTGSEAKPSGWASLDGTSTETARVATDAELISATLAARPDIVSIDSPLSLPPGATLTEDGKLGTYTRIHRDSELELRRRGVSVYWCLLPSMQALTLRGMRLAAAMRAQGLNVIESFPGAAQDILQLPRKRHGLDELRHSLAELGLQGPFVTDKVSHDELDAITSGLVGLFYLAGHYDALGASELDDLIIPRAANTADGTSRLAMAHS